jgi:hypothetical protein
MELLAVAKPEVSKWGRLTGRVREGVYPSHWGPGAVPLGKFKKKNRCMQVSLSAFSNKNQHTDSCIYTCKLW